MLELKIEGPLEECQTFRTIFLNTEVFTHFTDFSHSNITPCKAGLLRSDYVMSIQLNVEKCRELQTSQRERLWFCEKLQCGELQITSIPREVRTAENAYYIAAIGFARYKDDETYNLVLDTLGSDITSCDDICIRNSLIDLYQQYAVPDGFARVLTMAYGK